MYEGIECSAENEELTEAGKYQIPGKGSWSCVKRYWYNSQYQVSSWLEEIGKMRWNSSNLRQKRFAIFRTFLATLVMLQWILWTELLLCAAHGLAALANLVWSKIKITLLSQKFCFVRNETEKRNFFAVSSCVQLSPATKEAEWTIYTEKKSLRRDHVSLATPEGILLMGGYNKRSVDLLKPDGSMQWDVFNLERLIE